MISSLWLAVERGQFDRRVFFFVYLLLGFPYLVLTGPFRAPDERNHFLRSYEISELRFSPFRIANGVIGDNLPAGLSRLSEALGNHDQHRIEASQMRAARSVELHPQQRDFAEFSTAVYSPLAYIPSAISIAVGRLFGAGPLSLIYFARCGNLLVGSWLIACALSYAGYARLPALLITLFPMTISQVATVTADAMSFGVAFLWIALVMETAVAKAGEATLKRKVALVLLAVALSQLRPPYPLLSLLVLLVPARTFGKMGRVLAWSVIAASLVPAVAWNSAAAHLYEGPKRGNGETVDPRQQLEWIELHPGMFWHRVKQDLTTGGIGYWQQMVGHLGWLNIRLPNWIHAGFAAALILLTFLGSKKLPRPSWRQRAVLGAVVLVGIVAIELTLYLTFNGVASPFIMGVQGRYFTALAFIAAFASSNSRLDQMRWSRVVTMACLLFVACAHCRAWVALASAAGKI